MSYQAVIRNSSNQLVTSQIVGMKISILQGSATGTPVYTETQTPTTNANGLVSIEIGGETGFDAINWASGSYFMKTETDPDGGTNYTIAGTSQLLSVPFALHSKTADNVSGGITETDPVFVTHPASGITGINITNWTAAYDWGNHASAGYLTSFTETDPVFGVSPANGITGANITNWTTAYGWGNHAGLYRPISYVPAWNEITSNPFSFTSVINNQLLKYNSVSGKWENWTPDFLTVYSETDPIWTAASGNYYTKNNMQTSGASQLHFNNLTNKPTTVAGYGILDAMTTLHAANAITPVNITNWSSAYGWGNHATAGYLTSFTETDPVFGASPANGITSANISNWSSAYGWGNHASAGYLTSFTEADPVFGVSPANGITGANITNWSTAYGWGNHAGLYRPISYVPAWSEITSNPFSFTSSINNQLLKYNSVSGKWENWTPDFLTIYTETDPKVGANTSGYSPKWDGSALVTGSLYQDVSGNVGIGTQSPNAAMDISSTTGGILIPRMTTAERDLINNPA